MRRSKSKTKIIDNPEQLKMIEGWEIRRVRTDHPAIVLQNPDSGQRVRLVIGTDVFCNGSLKILSRERQPPAMLPINKRESDK